MGQGWNFWRCHNQPGGKIVNATNESTQKDYIPANLG